MSPSRTLVALLSLLAPLGAQDTERPRLLELDYLLDWESVSSPRMSPDGAHIVFSRSWTDKVNDRRSSALWIMGAEGERPRFLCDGSSPRWSPDGKRIAFLADGEPSGSQIHVMWVDTREVTQITRVERGPSNLRWSPDGTRIAFAMIVPEKQTLLKIDLPKPPKGAKWAEEPKIITRLNYRRDRSGYRPQGFSHLFVVDADGGTPEQITAGDFEHRSGEWTPDGKNLVFSGLREEDADWQVRESEIYAIDLSTREVRQLTDRAGPDSGPVVSPDGRFIAYTGYDTNKDTYNVAALHVMNVDGSDTRVLAGDLDRQISGLMWADDSSAVLFTAADEGARHVHRVALDGSRTALTSGEQQFRASDVGRDGSLVGVLTHPHLPGDVARLAGASGEMTRLTRVNDDLLSRVDLGRVENFRYKSVDDLECQAWLVFPPDFDPQKKYPLILQIHGGPHGMYGHRFSFERHNHAAHGYVVLYTNPRGSDGYGKAFGNAINNDYPGHDHDDLMGAVDEVIGRGYINADNLFVYGGSGGGVLTAWIVGKTDRFRAAVSMFPVINWISFVGTTDGPYWYTNFEKLPWEGIDEHWRRSPLRLVGNVVTPTLLITGELDLRTPMAQTEEYYQALKLRKVDTAMIRVPGAYHGAAGRRVSNQLRRILYVRGWFDKYRAGDESGAMEASVKDGGGPR